MTGSVKNIFGVTYSFTPGHYVFEGLILSQYWGDQQAVTASIGGEFYNWLGCNNFDPGGSCEGTVEQCVWVFFGKSFKRGESLSGRFGLMPILDSSTSSHLLFAKEIALHKYIKNTIWSREETQCSWAKGKFPPKIKTVVVSFAGLHVATKRHSNWHHLLLKLIITFMPSLQSLRLLLLTLASIQPEHVVPCCHFLILEQHFPVTNQWWF